MTSPHSAYLLEGYTIKYSMCFHTRRWSRKGIFEVVQHGRSGTSGLLDAQRAMRNIKARGTKRYTSNPKQKAC